MRQDACNPHLQVLFMVKIFRFAGVRPAPSHAAAIAAVPYDVVTAEEARAIIRKNPESFLRVSRSDAELPELPPSDDRVYGRAKDNFHKLLESGRLRKDPVPGFYLYRVQQGEDTFLGLCCCLDVDDYRNNRIRRHELTRYDKEEDRTRHIEAVQAHNGPVVLLFRNTGEISRLMETLAADSAARVAEVTTENGSVHAIFAVRDPAASRRLEELFGYVPALYIADGHHRAKSAVNVADRRKAAGKPADGEVSRFMGVMFAHDRVRIHGYSRLLTDLGPFTPEAFLAELNLRFSIMPYGKVDGACFNIPPRILQPERYHIIHMYLDGTWYECTRPVDPAAPTLETLDVAVLQDLVLGGMLGITDPRGDARLQYLGGARPVSDLMQLADSGKYRVAFAMQPVRVDTVLSIADAGGVMPPKSTWFEPKLLSGLVIHTFE